MIRVWSSFGPRLQKDAAWSSTFLGLVAYLAWQTMVLLLAVVAYLGRATDRCLVGPECGLVDGWSDGLVGFVALAIVTMSIGILSLVGRVTLAFQQRAFWTAAAVRIIAWVTLVAGIFGSLGWGLPWLVIGVYLVFASRRLTFETPERAQPDFIEGERV